MWVATLILGDEIQPTKSREIATSTSHWGLLNQLENHPVFSELYQPYTTLEIHYRKD